MKKIILALYSLPYGDTLKIQRKLLLRFPLYFSKIKFTYIKEEHQKKKISYNYISYQNFFNKLYNGELLEANQEDGIFIGTLNKDVKKNKINIGIFSKERIEFLSENPELTVIPIEIISNPRKRLIKEIKKNNTADVFSICEKFLERETRNNYQDLEIPSYLFFSDGGKIGDFKKVLTLLTKND